MSRRFLRSVLFPSEGWLSLVFSVAVMLSSARSVHAAGWVDDLELLTWLAVAAVVTGYLLSKVGLPSIALHVLALLVGGALVVYWTASTLPTQSLRSGVNELWGRFDHWLGVTLRGGVSTDNLLFLLLMCGLVWSSGYFGSWSVFRSRGPWWLILSSGAILVVNLSYARSLDWFALIYLLSSMALIVRLNLALQEDLWRRSGVQYAADFPWRMLATSILAGAAVIVAVWMGPEGTLSKQWTELWGSVSGPWQDAESQFSRFFGGVRSKDAAVNSSFGKTLALRGSTPLSDAPVLAISEPEPMYLRGVVYERYTGQGWLAPEGATQQLQSNDGRLMPDSYASREEVAVTISVLQPRGVTVLAPAQPLRVGLPVEADFATESVSGGWPVDLTTARSTTMLRRGGQYGAVASVSRANVKELREAGGDYPGWVRERYLALPQTIPRRVLALARSITVNTKNHYDRAVAIESYLRSYRYADIVPPPQAGRDAVDYFLFDLKLGYCDYYASAMVVALRSLGVPARVVSGYAPGVYDRERQVAVVRDSDAHSWPEVFFPRYGWIPFESTASRPVLDRTAEQPRLEPAVLPTPIVHPEDLEAQPVPRESGEEDANAPAATAGSGSSDRSPWVSTIAVIFAVVGLLYLAGLAGWRQMFRGHSPRASTYGRMMTLAGWLGISWPRQETPYEYGDRLAHVVPQAEADVQLIVDQFVRERYGQKDPTGDEICAIQGAWVRVRGHLIRLVLRRRSGVAEE